MRITNNFKNKLRIAKERGYKTVRVSRGGNWGNVAVSDYDIDYLLNLEIGDNSTSGGWGNWLTSSSNHEGVISYLNCFRL